MNPVIADVVSLANGSASQPSGSADAALTGQFTHAVSSGHFFVQTKKKPGERQFKAFINPLLWC